MCDHTVSISEMWRHVQRSLFPYLESVVESPLTERHQLLVWVIETVRPERFLPGEHLWSKVGAPRIDRKKIVVAFLAKAVMGVPTTKALRERLLVDRVLRGLCGWEGRRDVPSESTFSRAFGMFAETRLLDRVHEAIAKRHLSGEIVWHISRDATAIEGRERPALNSKTGTSAGETPQEETSAGEAAATPQEADPAPPKRGRGRPKKGEVVPPPPTTRIK